MNPWSRVERGEAVASDTNARVIRNIPGNDPYYALA